MEDSSLGHGGLHPIRPPASFSTSSLDIKLLVRTHCMQSLLSESVTLDSLSSIAPDSPPDFPPTKPSTFTFVGLGDHLKLFSTSVNQFTDVQAKSTTMISIPTLPRLKCMFKECLSIKKWAENSIGWQAPGHNPWMSTQTYVSRDWIPEGSSFSPEGFSIALFKARHRCNDLHPSPCFVPSTGSPPEEGPSLESCPQDNLKFDAELESSRISQFEDLSRDVSHISNLNRTANKLSLPALVVSDSHFTFPIPFESTSSIVGDTSGTLARRRGREVPPRLFLGQRETTSDLPYPDIPSAFWGLSSLETPHERYHLDLGNTATLRLEDMINNLRLQCLTLGPQTPPADPSWNSRSPVSVPSSPAKIPKLSMIGNSGRKDQPLSQTSINELKVVSPEARSASIARSVGVKTFPRPRKPSISRPRPLELCAETSTKDVPDIPKVISQAMTFPASAARLGNLSIRVRTGIKTERKLRSAMAKPSMFPTKRIHKTVRFAVVPNVTEEDCVPGHDNRKAEGTSDGLHYAESSRENNHNVMSSTSQKSPLQRSTSWTPKPLWKDLRRTRSVTSNQPRSHSSIVLMSGLFADSGDIDVEVRNGNDVARSTSSLGRHSLSRIIKGPIFMNRDSRRATIEMSGHGVDENAVRRESQSHPDRKRKSRMPIPLRNILTRFK
ncbi:hypothetical protein HYPSUDRAFT_34285 [Hypholoma sublateritium FD-334 SS-4]|uniref:Uncharacterized protein n=1 Tax=Hypholoma sublateritium (strain FD-334 SS-4) TaxID=945553 RepID=A0A0D2Q8H7_HYPSF|nr:hypothetical protein HYPSUDRAFT_34285 [Hypholoma sublateritium FD-334 SS-4]